MIWQDAEDEFQAKFKTYGKAAYVYRFTDTKDARGVVQSRKVFTDARPADFLVTFNGETFYAEVKSCNSETSFPLSNIRKAQWQAAVQQTAAKGQYYFFIRSEFLNSWFKVPFEFIKDIDDRKSIPWVNLLKFRWA